MKFVLTPKYCIEVKDTIYMETRVAAVNIISIDIDAPQDMISGLSGKIGKLKGVSSKAAAVWNFHCLCEWILKRSLEVFPEILEQLERKTER